jgi:glycosyltransferase involved in cell wall biosynthesis
MARRLVRRAPAWTVPWIRRLLGVGPPRLRRSRRAARATPSAPVTFFIWNVFSVGGTVRTVVRQASALAALGHDVTIVSVIRHRRQDEPFFPIDDRVAVEVLVDRRSLHASRSRWSALRRRLDAQPPLGTQFSMGREKQASALTDLALVRRVARARGTVIGTRLGLNLAIARFGHPHRALKVAQEHLYLARYHQPATKRAIVRHFRHLDVIACLTEADAEAYREALGPRGPRVVVVPNSIPDELPAPADPAATRIVAVGRLAKVKGFDRLLDAFAEVAEEYPEWTLTIIGEGGARAKLTQQIERLGLQGRVELPGETPSIQPDLEAASVYVLSSRFESFGIVLLEAMATGLAVVSFDCPRGPGEILDPGRTGLLVPDGDVRGLAEAMRELMKDEGLRARLGEQARRDVRRFGSTAVTARWAELLAAERPGTEGSDAEGPSATPSSSAEDPVRVMIHVDVAPAPTDGTGREGRRAADAGAQVRPPSPVDR